MKRFTLPAIAVCAVLLLALAVPAAATSRPEFQGNWKGADVDGSNLSLWIVQDG